jgi:hypothetical protein
VRRLRLGDLVQEHDGRHIGQIVHCTTYTLGREAMNSSVTVCWQQNGWRTECHPDELLLVEARREYEPPPSIPIRPSTMQLSPRARLEAYFAGEENE